MRISLCFFLFMPLYAQQPPQSAPVTPIKKLKHYEHMRTQSTDESIQEMHNLEVIRKQVEDKMKTQQPSSRKKDTK